MRLVLPPGVSRTQFDRALAEFAAVVGPEWVLATDTDRDAYVDAYAPGDGSDHAASAAVAPASVEQIQAVLRIANARRIPLWPISRGKNLGYGGAAPRMPGTVVLDLGRLNRILEVNERFGYCVVEPGVGFFDLHEHLEKQRIPLQMGTPGNAWGSVVGNALERGFSAAGDHSNNICGLEMLLPDGTLVRTGMGAMEGGKAGPLFKHGFGPSWDQFVVQSNYAIVTKMALWMQPADEAAVTIGVSLDEPDDVGRWVDALTSLRIRGILDGNLSVTSYQAAATTRGQRSEWYDGRDAIPDRVVDAIRTKYGVGWWNGSLRIAGPPAVCDARAELVLAALARVSAKPFPVTRVTGGAPRPAPSTFPLQIVNWYGGRGGHIGFSPVMPPDGRLVVEQLARTRARFREFGIDYSGTFYHAGRSVTNVNLILYNRDDAEQTARVRQLFLALVADAHAQGYGEYRTHLGYMDAVADSFDFNGHALRRLNETVKDALDPNGILAPGRNGIWPKAYRDRRGSA